MTKQQKKKTVSKETQKITQEFPVIGIGASAGGLEAIEAFFTHMLPTSNMAFVIIQHLDPTHKSIMASLIEKHTTMKVLEIKDGMEVEPNCIYLTPPNKNVAIMHRKLQLMDVDKSHGLNLPIDYFLRTLAEDQNEKAICIILSGTGTDGTLGLKEIKGAGGVTIAQQESQAKYDGMPRSAIDTGMVDYVLPVENMPEQILRYVQHPYIGVPQPVLPSIEKFENYLQKILTIIRGRTGHDFSNYKQNTICRRIERRMALHQTNKIAEYLCYLQQNPSEVESLHKDLLITVTNFFREHEAFEILKNKVIPALLEKRETDSIFRVWVSGCATGEEAYSIAIIFVEAMEKMKKYFSVQIFATDIDEDAIHYGRAGVYPESIAADVSEKRLNHFFKKEGHTYKVNKQIREMVIFATQNLIKDPPFSKLDLVSCRNVLIYMDQVLQKKILSLFHYTLNDNGILFLGSAESVGEFVDLFLPIDAKGKIFQNKKGVLEKFAEYPTVPLIDAAEKGQMAKEERPREVALRQVAEKAIMADYAPPCVLIDERYNVGYFHGDANKYLSLPVGEPSYNILKMASESLRYKLSKALIKAVKGKTQVIEEGLVIRQDDTSRTIDLVVKPLLEAKDKPQEWLLVVFDDKTPARRISQKKKKAPDIKEENMQIATLEHELQSTKEYLQTTIEELETSNEELKSTNEELQSTNEELQSTNEELETSKEEVQSTNEELVTVNAELQKKVEELSHANNDITNLLSSIEIGTIFLDTNFCIKRFTPAATKIFNLIQTDIGRPIKDITTNVIYGNLYEDTKEVLHTLVRKEMVMPDNKGQWYSMQILPYRTTENLINGVVVTFVNVTNLKKAEEAEQRLNILLRDVNDAVILQDLEGHILTWNHAAEVMYGYTEDEALNMNISYIIPDSKQKELSRLAKKIEKGGSITAFQTQRLTKEGQILDISLNISLLFDKTRNMNLIYTVERQIGL